MPATVLGRPLELRCGAVLSNRVLKSAMSEVLGDRDGAPTAGLATLYGTWADGGAGVLVSGNVMVDPAALGEPRNVIVEDERDLGPLSDWATAGSRGGTHLWMQLNHPGKQSPKALTPHPVAPSAVPLDPRLSALFAPPRALESSEITAIVGRFATTARIAQQAGFTGVQIHGAHGYLVSQFLSPRHNTRDDAWGGTPEKRMRFVLEVYQAIRAAVGAGFPVSIKLNSADFQRGGFTEEESMAVVAALADAGLDLVEISGGSYEAPVMALGVRDSTRQREAYFLDYAEKVRALVDVPLAVTGGFRTATGMADAVRSGATDVVGLARAFAVEPDLVRRILDGEDFHSRVRPQRTGFEAIDRAAMLEVTWYEQQISRLGAGKAPKPNRSPWTSLLITALTTGFRLFRQRRRASLPAPTDS